MGNVNDWLPRLLWMPYLPDRLAKWEEYFFTFQGPGSKINLKIIFGNDRQRWTLENIWFFDKKVKGTKCVVSQSCILVKTTEEKNSSFLISAQFWVANKYGTVVCSQFQQWSFCICYSSEFWPLTGFFVISVGLSHIAIVAFVAICHTKLVEERLQTDSYNINL